MSMWYDPYLSIFIYVLNLFAPVVSAIAWGIAYSYNVQEILNIAFLMIFRDFLVCGVVIATLIW